MNTLIAIAKICKRRLTYWKNGAFSLSHIKAADLNEHYGIVIQDEMGNQHDIDISKLMSETALGRCSDWDELLEGLTEELILGYSFRIPWSPFWQIFIDDQSHKYDKTVLSKTKLYQHVYYLEQDDQFKINYGTVLDPNIRNINAFKYKLKELIVTKNSDTVADVALSNSIFSVNGIVTRSYVYNDEAYLMDASKNIRGTYEKANPEITMINFDDLGVVTIHDFKDCEYRYLNVENEYTANTDIEVRLPDNVDLNNNTVFAVIAGKLYYPDELPLFSDNSFILNLSKLNIDLYQSLRLMMRDEYFLSTNIAQAEYGVEEYFNYIKANKDNLSFIFTVDNPNISIVRQPSLMQIGKHSIEFHTDVHKGILYNKTTRTIKSFVPINYPSKTSFKISPEDIIHRTDTPNLSGKRKLLAETNSWDNRSINQFKLVDLNDSRYECIFITG